ncbi:hypothetical protein FD720_17075 [Photobacterium damselae subsp. damselae]|uniref:Uncharacterized protein n=1 Tax=Photobacterium damselae TaxID=38293 RepID=A0A2T3QCQ7_PHODM|nr:hypothetical protein [Photobacterium damselae]PSW82021.1 hypothetical protein CTN07_18170 [Photobacterium damselae]TLS84526.1 hypothetical protein FD720_17075 [Photobacterium damselae subsp. damselae]SPY43718.1 Uncharacterised protein [Photobacterium damselae]
MKYINFLRCVLSDVLGIILSLIEPSLNILARLAFPIGLIWFGYTSYKVQGLGDMRAVYVMVLSAIVLISLYFLSLLVVFLKPAEYRN